MYPGVGEAYVGPKRLRLGEGALELAVQTL